MSDRVNYNEMLKITVLNRDIDLFDDTSIEYVAKNPIFTPDEVLVPYSYSYDIPPSVNNISIFRNPNVLTSRLIDPLPSSIFYMGVEIMRGSHIVEEATEDKITIRFEISDKPASLSKPLYKQYLGGLHVANSSAGQQDALIHYSTMYVDKANENHPDAVCAPIALGSKEWIREKQGDPDIYKTQRSSWINSFTAGSYTLPRRQDLALPPMIPSLRVGYIIDQLFSGTLHNNIFNSGRLASVMLVCSWHPDYKMNNSSPIWDVAGGSIDSMFARFMPDVPAIDLLTDMLKLACASIFYVKGELVAEYKQNMFSSTGFVDWSGKLLDGYSVSSRPAGKYVYGYGAKVDKKTDAPKAFSEVSTVREMLLDAIRTNTTSKMYDVSTLGLTFLSSPDPGKSSRVKFELMSQNMGEPEREDIGDDSNGDFSIKLSASPVFMNLSRSVLSDIIDPASDALDNKAFMFSPEMDLSTGGRPKDLTIGCYAGMNKHVSTSTIDSYYPMIGYTNISPHGDIIGGVADLRWDGDGGLIKLLHRSFKQWVESPHKVVGGQVKLEHADVANLDLRKRYYIDGDYFFIDEITIRFNGISGIIADIVFVSVN